MLRTTISRIRKVCSVGYIPRLLRGDQSNSGVSSTGIRKAHDTTKSTDDGEQATTLSSAANFKIVDKFKNNIGETLSLDKTANKRPILTTGLPLTQRERCQRIIEQAFGKADDTQPERALSEQYFSGTVNLEDTRREIHESEKAKLKLQEQKIHIDNPLLPDDRTQYGIFKMSRELNMNEDNQDEIVIMDSASATEPDLTKNSENVKETAEETLAVEEPYIPPAKEDFDKCVNNLESIEKKALCDDDDAEIIEVVKSERKSDPFEKATSTYQSDTLQVLNATTAKEDEELLTEPYISPAKEDCDKWVKNLESVEKKAFCDADAETIEVVKGGRKSHPYEKATPTYQSDTTQVFNASTAKEDEELLTEPYISPAQENYDKWIKNLESTAKKELCDDDAEIIEVVKGERKSDPYEKATPTYQSDKPQVLNATTAKEDEELLTQKLETIEETPIVEAQKPKLEGFNVTPRVSGNDPTLNSKILEKNRNYSPKAVLPDTLEEVSKRCLNCPLGQIDEILINEMEKLGMTFKAAQKSPSTPMEDDLVQMDVTNKQPNSTIVRTAQKSPSAPMEDDLIQMDLTNKQPKSTIVRTAQKSPSAPMEDDLVQMDVTNKQPNSTIVRTSQKAPSPPMEDDLVQMDVTNKQPNSTIVRTAQKSPTTPMEDDLVQMNVTNKQPNSTIVRTAQKSPSTPMEDDLVQMNVTNKQPNSTIVRTAQKSRSTPMEDDLVQMDVTTKQPNSTIVRTAQKSRSTSMEDDLVQMDVTTKQPNSTIVTTAQKAPSTPMEDDLVQMDALNTLPKSTFQEQKIHSDSPELDENKNETATDSRIPDENEQAETLRTSEESEKPAQDILYPDHIRVQLNPVCCKLEEYNPTNDYNSTIKLSCYYLPRAAELNKQIIEDTVPNSRVLNKLFEEPFSLDGPSLKGPLSETPNSHAFKNNQTAEPYSIQSREGNVFETAQNVHTASAAAEAEKTDADDINTNVPPFDPLNDDEELLKPENSSYLKEVNRLPYNATINASKPAGDENQTSAERELDKNSFYSRNLAAEYESGHHQNSSAAKNINEHQTFPKETDEVENHGKTPIRQSTSEVQRELAERQTTVNYLLAKVPSTNVSLPGEKWNKEIEHLPTVDKITQQCSNKLYSTESLEPKPEQDSEKVSLPEELLKEHRLNPYYVLTCNETCPISPGSSISGCQNSDIVDTTETLCMNKNICESLRPKPQPIMECKNMSSDTQAHLNDMEFKPEDLPEIKSTGTLEMQSTGMPEIKCTSVPNATRSMPKLDEQVTEVALSELLRRVREKSRLTFNKGKSGLDVQAVGKCGKKAPRCHPMAPRSPPNNPVPPPSFGLPMLKRAPPACKPKRKPSNKCSCVANDGEFFPEMPYELNEAEVSAVRSKVNLTDEVIDRLQNLGKILGGVLRRTKSGIEMLLVRDYEPWTPIPSWKIPPKVQKKEWRPASPCVDGCPVFPKARASMDRDPPCNLKPCEGFPKRRSFSMLDCFTVSLGEKKVYDLGYF